MQMPGAWAATGDRHIDAFAGGAGSLNCARSRCLCRLCESANSRLYCLQILSELCPGFFRHFTNQFLLSSELAFPTDILGFKILYFDYQLLALRSRSEQVGAFISTILLENNSEPQRLQFLPKSFFQGQYRLLFRLVS